MSADYVKDPEAWLENVSTTNDIVCIVIFRGHWCKYDEHYLKALGAFHKEIMEKEGVKLIAWTSEGPEGAAKADAAWHLTKDFAYHQVIGDDTNALADFLKDDMLLEHIVTATPEEAHVKDKVTAGSYPKGIVQPGMLWYVHHSLALQWESKFDEKNLYGAANRPLPSEIWRQVEKRKHALDLGNAIMPVHGNELKMCTLPEDVN